MYPLRQTYNSFLIKVLKPIMIATMLHILDTVIR